MVAQILDYLVEHQSTINLIGHIEKEPNYEFVYYTEDDGRLHIRDITPLDVKSIDLHFDNNTAFITFFGDE